MGAILLIQTAYFCIDIWRQGSKSGATIRSLTDMCEFRPEDSLDGGDVLSGFRASLASLV